MYAGAEVIDARYQSLSSLVPFFSDKVLFSLEFLRLQLKLRPLQLNFFIFIFHQVKLIKSLSRSK